LHDAVNNYARSNSAEARPTGRRSPGQWAFNALLALGLAGFILASALFVYQQSRSVGLPPLSWRALTEATPGAPGGAAPPGKSAGTTGGFAHQNGPCIACHGEQDRQARLYLALDGRDVSDRPAITVQAGGVFELAFHFEGMLGDPDKFAGVGVAVVLPRDPNWTIGPGTGKAVAGWGDDLSPNAIEVYVSRLRSKLEPAGIKIRTVRGFGYMLEEFRGA